MWKNPSLGGGGVQTWKKWLASHKSSHMEWSELPSPPLLITCVFCCCLVTQSCLFATPCTAAQQASLSFIYYLPEFAQIHIHRVSDAIPPSHPLPSPSPFPSIFPSIRVFSSESLLCIRWPKYWSFSISPSNECSGLISFRIDWFDLLAAQRTCKSLLQHYCSKASILQCSAFFMVQLSHPCMTTGKTIALTRWTFVGKVMSLLFYFFLSAF